MPVSKAKFSEGEKVLCYHGLLLYDAKVCLICVSTTLDLHRFRFSLRIGGLVRMEGNQGLPICISGEQY